MSNRSTTHQEDAMKKNQWVFDEGPVRLLYKGFMIVRLYNSGRRGGCPGTVIGYRAIGQCPNSKQFSEKKLSSVKRQIDLFV
jgi:hypothetical protein